MSYSNGTITAPVSIYDVQRCCWVRLQRTVSGVVQTRYSGDVGVLCGANVGDTIPADDSDGSWTVVARGTINKWAYHKPVACRQDHNTPSEMSPNSYSVPTLGLQKNATTQHYTYVHITPNTHFARLTDFNGYNHYAFPPIKETEYLGAKDVWNMYVNPETTLMLKTPFRVGDIPLAVFMSITSGTIDNSWYVGYLIEDENNIETARVYSEQLTLAAAINGFVTGGQNLDVGYVPWTASETNGRLTAYFGVFNPQNENQYELFCPEFQFGIQTFDVVLMNWNLSDLWIYHNEQSGDGVDMNESYQRGSDDPDDPAYQNIYITYTPSFYLCSSNVRRNIDWNINVVMQGGETLPSSSIRTNTTKRIGDILQTNSKINNNKVQFPTYVCPSDRDGRGSIDINVSFRGETFTLFSGVWDGNQWTSTWYRPAGPQSSSSSVNQ